MKYLIWVEPVEIEAPLEEALKIFDRIISRNEHVVAHKPLDKNLSAEEELQHLSTEDIAERMVESRQKIDNAFCFCKQIYHKHESTKRDSWRNMSLSELWDLWQLKSQEAFTEDLEELADLVNYTIMIMARKAEIEKRRCIHFDRR
ncbi:MAG: hypothetical protein AYK18_14975 [Theionarchaea archaeon DG-70]|nr:MAG: hypothetical protein AYK18_14975 [Theionarchaea archaeon DG-70]